MRIISQDGKASINLENVTFMLLKSNFIVIQEKSTDKAFNIGEYKTEERAMEVFMDIHERYMSEKENSVYYMPQE